MRDLTAEELALAPEWATHYIVDVDDDVLFESETYFLWLVNGVLKVKGDNDELSIDAVEIKRKPFDITQHELNDHLTELESGNLGVNDCGWIIDKERAITIAKALGVTAEDLK